MKRFTPLFAIAIVMMFAVPALAGHRHRMQSAPVTKTAHESDRTAPTPDCIADGDQDGDGVPDRLDRCGNTPHGCRVDDYGCPWDSDQDGVCDGLDQCADTPMGSKVDADGCDASQLAARSAAGRPMRQPESKTTAPAPAPVPAPAPAQSEMEKRLIATGELRLENVYFETSSAKLLPESEATLNEAGHALEHFADLKIEVEGHTDTRGSAAYNKKLSQARAESVRAYLLDHFHLNADNYTAAGYGESRPEVKEKNDEDRQRNRRVVLEVKNPDALPHGVEVKK
ncbi:MAG: OmpA family protein [Candidatus Eisenbacteria bacterium]|nr:OmpA family protein [Candidatus Eisenbacteria bacterium]